MIIEESQRLMTGREHKGPEMLDHGTRYLDQEAAARLLCLSVSTLERMRREGHGPAFMRIGMRRIAYDEAEIRRWATARTFPHRAAELARSAA